jgi:hypothetical protein
VSRLVRHTVPDRLSHQPAHAGRSPKLHARNRTMTSFFADGNWWWWLSYFSSASSRGNVITLCVVIVCFSLFILMKK